MLKEPDPEIVYPIYDINEQVCYTDGGQFPVGIGVVSRYMFHQFMNYKECPGYDILFQTGNGDQVFLWCPYFQVLPLNKTNPSTIRRVLDVVQCYSKERGNCGEVLGSNESEGDARSSKEHDQDVVAV
eukprot:jgi/Psemu1/15661/gm1.15661_g